METLKTQRIVIYWKFNVVEENIRESNLASFQGLRKFNFRCNNDAEILANTFFTWLYLIDADIIIILFANFSYILCIIYLRGFTILFGLSFTRFPKEKRNRVTKI